MREQYMRHGHCFLFVFSLNSRGSFDELSNYYPTVQGPLLRSSFTAPDLQRLTGATREGRFLGPWRPHWVLAFSSHIVDGVHVTHAATRAT